VLYELLEGRRPFEAESFSEMCVKVAIDPPSPMTNTPPGLQEVVLRCLAKLPEHRYASMAELARDLVPFSNDPHQAQVLVERMSRMLRRSQAIDWDPARNSMPMLVREVRSAERQAESAEVAEPEPERPSAREHRRSAAGRVPSKTHTVPAHKRRRAILVAGALAGAASLGVAISFIREPAPRPPAPAPDRTDVVVPARPHADDHPAVIEPARSPGSAADAVSPKPQVVPSPTPAKRAAGQGKPGNIATSKHDGVVPPTKPACKVDPFGGPHASNACPSDN
jgi:serine/threonine protein kinase